MATVTLKGNEIHTSGNLPSVGSAAPDFNLTKTDLSKASLSDYAGKKVVLNINMDMIAHNDSLQLYASGLFHYPQLKPQLEDIESPITLLFGHDDKSNKKQDDWTFSSDHRIFHKRNIPFIYFGVDDHKDYHRDTDTFENINQDFYVEAVKLIIQVIENYDTSL